MAKFHENGDSGNIYIIHHNIIAEEERWSWRSFMGQIALDIIRQWANDKSPEPGGYTIWFFQSCSYIINEDN